MRRRLLTLTLLVSTIFPALQAQDHCCAPAPGEDHIRLIKERVKTLKRSRTRTNEDEVYYFKVKYHVMYNHKNGEPFENLNNLLWRTRYLNERFADANIQFIHCEDYNLISSEGLGSIDYQSSEEAQLLRMKDPEAINVYFVKSVPAGAGYVGPYPYNEAIFIGDGATSSSTYPHEMGHIFELLHTFGKSSHPFTTDEKEDGSNCLRAGDYLCDTPADPNSWANCSYDPDGRDRDFNPDASNLMAYSGSCRERFSPDQIAVMRSSARTTWKKLMIPETLAFDQNYTISNNVTPDNSSTSAKTYTAFYINANNDIKNNSNIDFKAEKSVFLGEGFEVTGSNFEVSFEDITCESDFSSNPAPEVVASISELDDYDEEEVVVQEGLKGYPNPCQDQFTVQLDDGVTVEYVVVVDNLGRQVLSNYQLEEGRIRLETIDLSPGMYTYLVNDSEGNTFKGRFLKGQ